MKKEVKEEEAKPQVKEQPKQTKVGINALWTPLGWPHSRTLAHSEMRTEGDKDESLQ